MEYAKRVQEANAHRREILVTGDPACAFVSCLYDASKGPISQLVTKPPAGLVLICLLPSGHSERREGSNKEGNCRGLESHFGAARRCVLEVEAENHQAL
ncbi:hypothetical protein B9Z55_026340 [Caenorhabditis nigoni]|uniref:Uncharacterized protein n=1 Tax=Caenorhabditis nigoni TaxID=1611254 RepID=A0A2G5T2P0_9PELO|nr:hypothetical protein B9Z55_026340 [Caenorhabditis nigoni]